MMIMLFQLNVKQILLVIMEIMEEKMAIMKEIMEEKMG